MHLLATSMKIVELGDIIASRSLTREIDGNSVEVTVLIGKPRQLDDPPNYFTPYQFRGVGQERIKYAVGIDAVHALQLAMMMIGAELAAVNRKIGNKISWECGDEDGDLGFPVTE